MNGYDCEAIRDLLPSLLRDELAAAEAAAARTHLDACADCRADAEIVKLLQATLAPVPAGLESKVMHAVRHNKVKASLWPFAQWPRTRMALAATLAAVAIGGSLVFQQVRNGGAYDADLAAMSWAAMEDPLLHGTSELHQLSAEDLEILLSELEP